MPRSFNTLVAVELVFALPLLPAVPVVGPPPMPPSCAPLVAGVPPPLLSPHPVAPLRRTIFQRDVNDVPDAKQTALPSAKETIRRACEASTIGAVLSDNSNAPAVEACRLLVRSFELSEIEWVTTIDAHMRKLMGETTKLGQISLAGIWAGKGHCRELGRATTGAETRH